MKVAVHGDDFAVLGPWRHVQWLRQILESVWEITLRGSMGPSLGRNSTCEVRLLGRIIMLTTNGYVWEAGPKHAETVIKRAGVENGNGVSILGLAASAYEFEEYEDEDGKPEE